MPDPITILDPISLISDPITMISEPNKLWYLTQSVWYLAQSHNAIFYHFWPYHNDIWWNNNHIWPSQTDIWPSYQGPYHMDISAFFHYWVFLSHCDFRLGLHTSTATSRGTLGVLLEPVQDMSRVASMSAFQAKHGVSYKNRTRHYRSY